MTKPIENVTVLKSQIEHGGVVNPCLAVIIEPYPDDCTNMVLYGDGKKFISPVWYSCGRCNPCPRDPEAK